MRLLHFMHKFLFKLSSLHNSHFSKFSHVSIILSVSLNWVVGLYSIFWVEGIFSIFWVEGLYSIFWVVGMFSILVKPIAEKDIFITKIKRPLENKIIENYFKRIKKEKV